MLRDDFQTYIDKLGIKLRPAQEKVINELLKFPKVSNITWARGTGKSFMLGVLAFFLARYFRWTVIITAPTISQCWAIMRWVHWAKDRLIKKRAISYDNRYELILKRGGEVVCKSGNITSHPESVHGQVVIGDEKQDIEISVVTAGFFPMLADKDGSLILSGIGGNPESAGEQFKKDSDYISEYPWQEHIKYFPHYLSTVEKEKKVMLPEEFAANYECKPFDLSSRLLIPKLIPAGLFEGEATSMAGIDFGKRIDLSVVTLAQVSDAGIHVDSWGVFQGSYVQQIKMMKHYLTKEVEWDYIFAEGNGVGDAAGDMLIEEIPEANVIMIDRDWKNERARELHCLSVDGKLKYNHEHELSGMFVKELGEVKYKMTSMKSIELDHSDFLSSLFMTMEQPKYAHVG